MIGKSVIETVNSNPALYDMKFRFRYSGGFAVVERGSRFGDVHLLAAFKFGKDAKEYVDRMNSATPQKETDT